MADDHSKTKDELPQRPRGGHPYRTAELPPLPSAPRARRRILRVRGWLVAVAAATVALTACGPTFDQGPAGTVVDKDRDYKASTKTYWNFLTVRTSGGSEREFRVTLSDYDACYRGSAYPKCANR